MKWYYNFFNKISFKRKNKENYNVEIADPITRFCAFLVDSFIIYSILSLFIFIIIKKDMIPEAVKNEEVSFSIDANNNIDDLKNVTIDIEKKKFIIIGLLDILFCFFPYFII